MSANDKQIGGRHYAGETQHWDIVYSVFGGDYLIGNATKYLARLGKKGGPEKALEDIDKAIHYLVKKRENLVLELNESANMDPETVRFKGHYYPSATSTPDSNTPIEVCHDYDLREGSEPDRSYVCQDPVTLVG